ncbi:MAG: transcriptional regulator [Syntrophomonadaceae bacterium]|nr:transcriptional regulator [Syntrophomonadaceae bacterium]
MFKVNDYVVYGSTGVCQIVDISQENIMDDNKVTEYYVLQPVFDDTMTIKIPVDNTKVLMRRIITKDDVKSLIKTIPEQETVWIEDNKERIKFFKEAIRSGNCEEWIKVIKTLYLEKEERSEEGKKLTKTDEDLMKTAEKFLHEEFAVVLNISPEEVPSYIEKHIS